MTTPLPTAPTTTRARLIQELLGLMCLVLGGTGLVTAAWLVDYRLGVAVLSVLSVAIGIALSTGTE